MTPDHYINIAKLVIGLLVSLGAFKGVKWWGQKQGEFSFYKKLAEHHEQRAARADPDKCRALDLDFKSGERIVALLIMGESLTVGPGVSITGVYSDAKMTSYLVQVDNAWPLSEHRHNEKEVVTVISGTMLDRDSGKTYSQGDVWSIPANKWHSVLFESPKHGPCIVKVDTYPPLPTLEDSPLQLGGIGRLTGA